MDFIFKNNFGEDKYFKQLISRYKLMFIDLPEFYRLIYVEFAHKST